MTAEVVVMNKQGIALAADSAVSSNFNLGTHTIYGSDNKVFALSKYHPVGVMVYGSAGFMGIPWEIIIKEYRKELDNKEFDTLKEYKENFISFLSDNKRIITSEIEQDYMVGYATNLFHFVTRIITDTHNLPPSFRQKIRGFK